MAVISPSSIAKAVQATLRESIARQARTGNISLVDELMGYSLASQTTSEAYAKQPSVETPQRVVASPEILTGLVKSRYA